jgi:dipeptidyl aminopeptidase/acylaminoacyl peptidase
VNDQEMTDSFYNTVDTFIRVVGPERVSQTDVFFRISRAAIGSNVDYSELQRIVPRITSLTAWYEAFRQSAESFARLAEAAEAKRHLVTAGEHYLRAALLYHFAQLFTRPEDPRRAEAQRRRVDDYRRAAPYLSPPVSHVEVQYGDLRLPGYFRRPAGGRAVPLVLMIPGANSVKEELHNWGHEFLKRGLATFAFDGPGQGELSVRHDGPPLRFETYPAAVSAVIDHFSKLPGIQVDRITAWGQSTGGHLALQAAAHDARIRAAVSLGGGYDFRKEIELTTPADVREEGRDLHGFSSFAETEAYLRQHGSLLGWTEKIRCPVLLIHGAQDNIVDLAEMERIRQEVAGPAELLVYPDGNHSVCNRNLEMSAAMADWVADQMAGPGAASEGGSMTI